jgi:hypothetical protein
LGHGRSEVISSDKKTGEEKRITEVQDEEREDRRQYG